MNDLTLTAVDTACRTLGITVSQVSAFALLGIILVDGKWAAEDDSPNDARDAILTRLNEVI